MLTFGGKGRYSPKLTIYGPSIWITLTEMDAQGSTRAEPKRPTQIAFAGGGQKLPRGAGTHTRVRSPQRS